MRERKLEPWETLPPNWETWKATLERVNYPELPENTVPEVGKFYRLYPENTWSGCGSPYHGNLRVGTDSENLIIYFNGGGVSYDAYTAARGWNMFTGGIKETYYSNDAETISDFFLNHGLSAQREDNPFLSWSMIQLPYANGDFHAGDGEFPYTALDGSQRMMKYHGFRNAMAAIRMALPYLPHPRRLLIAGSSAGGAGTSFLADDIISLFPECKDITVCVDSMLMFGEWQRIARNVWHSPESITDKLKSDCFMLDNLTALREKYGERIRIGFISSVRDALLVEAQNGLDGKGLVHDRASGERYQKRLAEFCAKISEKIPDISFYIFKDVMDAPGYDADELTLHCVLNNQALFEHREEELTPCCWLKDLTEGNMRRAGLGLLEM